MKLIWTRAAMVFALLLGGAADGIYAQQQTELEGSGTEQGVVGAAVWKPAVFAYGLEQVAEQEVDPFGSDGRREVIQLMADRDGVTGRFVRSRMVEGPGGLDLVREQGWYAIQGGEIDFYHADAAGATGKVDVARYEAGRICAREPASGAALRFELIAPAGGDAVMPPAGAPSAPDDCPAVPNGR